MPTKASISSNKAIAIFGAGCFWCIEAIFQELNGVASVESGYMGGEIENPTYEQVCSGNSGHAEIAKITFDPNIITFTELLEVFWQTHDPTTLNKQGADKGTQYRSVIFYVDAEQKQVAESYKKKLTESGAYPNPIVTEISESATYFAAENYHQEYYVQNQNQGYCQFVIKPKLDKFRAVFAEKLKNNTKK